MAKYLCMQRSLKTSGATQDEPSPAQMQEMYAQFGAWMEKFKANLVDPGGKLGSGELVTADDTKDGPFPEVKELVGGYMIVEAPTLEEAKAVVNECPGLINPRSACEVIEIIAPGG